MLGYYGPGVWLLIIAGIFTLYAQMKVSSAFNKYERVKSLSGYTGSEVARRILDINGLNNIQIQAIGGSMTDYYNPLQKQLALSQTVYDVSSISAISVAAHEAGHAIQDAKNYKYLKLRHVMFPVTSFSSKLAMPLVLIGFVFGGNNLLVDLGILLFSVTTLYALVTLPVEFNASKRALAILKENGILSPQELPAAKEVLNAAALTYVAAAATSIVNLLRLLMARRRN